MSEKSYYQRNRDMTLNRAKSYYENNVNVIYLGYSFVFIKIAFLFFCLQNLRSFCLFLHLVKKSKFF